MASDHSYYVLTLTVHVVEFHKWLSDSSRSNPWQKDSTHPSQAEEIMLLHLPTNLQEALRYDALDRKLQTHHQQEFLHRHYQSVDLDEIERLESEELLEKKDQKYLRRYLHEVDNAICDILKESSAPLLLRGDVDICALYREISSYPHLAANDQNDQSLQS